MRGLGAKLDGEISRYNYSQNADTYHYACTVRYIIFVIDSASNTAGGNEIAAIDAFNDQLRENGNWIYAAGIAVPEKAQIIDNRSDADLVTTGSLFTDSEHYSGFWLIEADSDTTALTLAKAGSKACNRKVELRPFLG